MKITQALIQTLAILGAATSTNAASLRGSKEDSQSQQYASRGSARKNHTAVTGVRHNNHVSSNSGIGRKNDTILGRKNAASAGRKNATARDRKNETSAGRKNFTTLTGAHPNDKAGSGRVSKQTGRKGDGHYLRDVNFVPANGGAFVDESEEYGWGWDDWIFNDDWRRS